jgi:16S rRNA (guanine(1405)-N(7))-methyltransferase
MDTLLQITDKISNSKKYKSINEQTISRIVNDVAKKYNRKQVENISKKLLHQIWGAYYTTRPNFNKLEKKIFESINEGKLLKETVLPILSIHSSTKERVPILDFFYKDIFAITGTPNSIVDYACGLNPVTLPWMQLPSGSEYKAIDIDKEEISFFAKISKLYQNITFVPEVGDLFEIQNGKIENFHTAFLFKILPVLEQQQKGITISIIKKINAKFIVVTYPTTSLSKNDKGMTKFYSNQFETLANENNWEYKKISLLSEIIFIIKKYE